MSGDVNIISDELKLFMFAFTQSKTISLEWSVFLVYYSSS